MTYMIVLKILIIIFNVDVLIHNRKITLTKSYSSLIRFPFTVQKFHIVTIGIDQQQPTPIHKQMNGLYFFNCLFTHYY